DRPVGDPLDRAPDVERPQAADAAGDPVLEPVGLPRPDRLAEAPASGDAALRPAGRHVVVGVGRLPAAPAPVEAARPEADRPGAPPVEADEVEAPRRGHAGERARGADGQVAGPDRRRATALRTAGG